MDAALEEYRSEHESEDSAETAAIHATGTSSSSSSSSVSSMVIGLPRSVAAGDRRSTRVITARSMMNA